MAMFCFDVQFMSRYSSAPLLIIKKTLRSKHLKSTQKDSNTFSGQSFKGFFLFCCSHKCVISHLISNVSPLTNRHMVLDLTRPWPRNEYAYPGTSVACYPGMNSTQA